MSLEPVKFTTPVGRLVGGSVYEPKTTDYDGKPLVVKGDGPNKGQPRVEYSFGVAFEKTPGVQHWANEPWLKPIWALGHAAFPGDAQRPDFAWKITDGDSTIPKRGRNGQPGKKPCENEGYPGHWVIWFSGGQAPRLWNADSTVALTEPGAIKGGYFVQVAGNAKPNTGATPGLYFNHNHVALAGFGKEISFLPDVKEAGFGQAPLPAGASAVPVAAMPAMAPAVPNAPGAPLPPSLIPASPSVPVPAAPISAPSASLVMTPKAAGATYASFKANPAWTDQLLIDQGYAYPPAPNAPPPVGSAPMPPTPVPGAPVPPAVTASAAILQIPAAPVMAAPVPVPVAHVMTPKAGAFTYEQFKADPQWTDEALRAHGYMV